MYPLPKLSIDELIVLEVLRTCRNKWVRIGGFGYERKVSLPFSAIKEASELLKVRLTKARLQMLLACEDALIADDITALKEK